MKQLTKKLLSIALILSFMICTASINAKQVNDEVVAAQVIETEYENYYLTAGVSRTISKIFFNTKMSQYECCNYIQPYEPIDIPLVKSSYYEPDQPDEIINEEKPVEEIVTEEVVEDKPVKKKKKTADDYLKNMTQMSLPSTYYDGLDWSSMQTWMDYRKITDTSSDAWRICRSDKAYVDNNGYLRYEVKDDEFSLGDNDDFVVAMGTFYKTKDVCGERFLIKTTTGEYTVITGDEKDDSQTDSHNMYHDCYGNKVSVLEFVVDTRSLEHDVKRDGTVHSSTKHEMFNGDIIGIYKIN